MKPERIKELVLIFTIGLLFFGSVVILTFTVNAITQQPLREARIVACERVNDVTLELRSHLIGRLEGNPDLVAEGRVSLRNAIRSLEIENCPETVPKVSFFP